MGVIKRLKKPMIDFLWKCVSKVKVSYLVNWEMIQRPKNGVTHRKYHCKNKTLLGKWLWRFPIEKNAI